MPLQSAGEEVCRLINSERYGRYSDRDLLDLFLKEQDQQAFKILLTRHDRLIRAAIGSIIHDPHDADDAYQATFLVFLCRARKECWRDGIGPWLYGVAHRVSLAAVRKRREKRLKEAKAVPQKPSESPDPAIPAACRILREEIDRLPRSLKKAVLLCDIGGMVPAQAARALGIHRGTVLRQISKGREKLNQALARRGVSLAAALPTLRADQPAPSVNATDVLDAVRNAPPHVVSLAQEAVMTSAVAKTTKAVVCAILLAGASGWYVRSSAAPAGTEEDATRLSSAAAQDRGGASVEPARLPKDGPKSDKPAENPARTANADREAAKWVLKHEGGSVVTDPAKVVRDLKDLPKEEFFVTDIYVPRSATITREALELFSRLPRLGNLRVNAKQAVGVGLEHIQIPSLRSLKVCGWRLSDKSVAAVAGMDGLKVLHLGETDLTDGQLGKLTKLADLRELNLRGTSITDAGLRHLAKLEKLETLDVSETRVTRAALEKLKLPGLMQLTAEKLRRDPPLGK